MKETSYISSLVIINDKIEEEKKFNNLTKDQLIIVCDFTCFEYAL